MDDTDTPQTPADTPTPDVPATDQPQQTDTNAADIYSLDTDPTPPANTPPQDDGSPTYAITWPEGFSPSDEFSTLATSAARQAGLDAAAAGAYTAAVWQQLQQLEHQRRDASDAALRQEWGADFESNLAGAKNLLRQLEAAGHVDEEASKLLQSPKGMKLLRGLSTFVGEKPAAGTQHASPDASAWAHEVMTNPSHPDYKAFHNPTDPRWREVNTRYNSIKFGLR